MIVSERAQIQAHTSDDDRPCPLCAHLPVVRVAHRRTPGTTALSTRAVGASLDAGLADVGGDEMAEATARVAERRLERR